MEMGRRGEKAMSRDEGGFMLSHTWDTGALVHATGRLGPLGWPPTCRGGVVRLARRIWQPWRRCHSSIPPGYLKPPLSGTRFRGKRKCSAETFKEKVKHLLFLHFMSEQKTSQTKFCKEICHHFYLFYKCSHDKRTVKLIQIESISHSFIHNKISALFMLCAN